MQAALHGVANVVRGVDGFDPSPDLVDDELHGEGEELGLAGKDVPERSRRDAGLGRDLANGGRRDPVAQHDTPDRFPELAAARWTDDRRHAHTLVQSY